MSVRIKRRLRLRCGEGGYLGASPTSRADIIGPADATWLVYVTAPIDLRLQVFAMRLPTGALFAGFEPPDSNRLRFVTVADVAGDRKISGPVRPITNKAVILTHHHCEISLLLQLLLGRLHYEHIEFAALLH